MAGGASFMAMKEWEDHQRKEGTSQTHLIQSSPHCNESNTITSGKEVNHSFAKEAIAAIAGVEVDRLAETKGADYIDREKTKHEAKKRSEQLYDQHYGQEENYNPNKKHPHKKIQEEFGGNY